MLSHSISLFFFTQLALGASTFIFQVSEIYEGVSLPYPKDKHGVKPIGEDSFGTSPHSLVVCDGISATSFSSKYISSYIANRFQRAILKKFRSSDFFFNDDIFLSHVLNNIDDSILKYNSIQKDFYQSWDTKGGQSPVINLEELRGSTTFMGAVLTTEKDQAEIKFIQKGDSLAVVFRKTQFSQKGLYYYLPVFMSEEQQYEFNFPYQFCTQGPNSDDDVRAYSLNAEADDIVILGTDGLFDNMHLGFLTIMINSFLAFPESNLVDHWASFAKITDLLTEILKKKNWVVQQFYQKSSSYPLAEENNYEVAPAHKTGRSYSSNVNKIRASNYRKRIVSNKQNAFGKFLETKILEITGQKAFLRKKQRAFKKYFECPVLEMMSHPQEFGENDNLISPCVKKILKKHFAVDETAMSDFKSKFDGQLYSRLIARAAKKLSNLVDNYPNPFFINAWKNNKYHQDSGQGKKDDITVIMSLVQETAGMSIELNKSFEESYKEEKKSLMSAMKADVDSFLNYFWNLKQELKTKTQMLETNQIVFSPIVVYPKIQKNEVLKVKEPTSTLQETGKASSSDNFFGFEFKKINSNSKKNRFSDKNQSLGEIIHPTNLFQNEEEDEDLKMEEEQESLNMRELKHEKTNQILEEPEDEYDLAMQELDKANQLKRII